MMILNAKALFILLFSALNVQCFQSNSNKTDLSHCKVHYSRSERSYIKFFQITEDHRKNNSLTFDFHFAVQAPSDAHILLSPSPVISSYDPVYEIVLGAGGNSFSEIRRLQKAATKRSAITQNVLSALDVKPFWLHVAKDGMIEVGNEGEELAFLSWRDPSPLPIEVFSFSTWPGIEAKWYYDCLREDNTASDSQEIEPILTPRQKLKKQLFSFYDPYVRPSLDPYDLIIIHFKLNYERVTLDEINSKMVLYGTMQMEWQDEKIIWDKNEFDNIKSLRLSHRSIWQPDLILYNSASGPGTDFFKSTNLIVTSEGWVTWQTQVRMEAWCDASGLGHWPNDHHSCEIQLGFWTQGNYLHLLASANSSLEQKYSSEWKINSVESGHYLMLTPLSTDYYSDTFIIKFYLHRSSNIYTTIYFAPLFVVAVSLLASFWVSPIGPYRISLHCFQLIILSLIITKLGIMIPAHPTNVPYLVLLYSYGFIATLIALIFSIIFMNWAYTKHTNPLPYYIYRFLSLKYIRMIVYVNGTKFSESYDKLVDDSASTDIDIQEMWMMLSIMLDRFLFIIYLFFIIISLSKQY